MAFIGCPKKNFLSQNTFLGHSIESIVHGAESFSVIANIEQDDRPLFDTKIHQTFKLYWVSQKMCLCPKTPFWDTRTVLVSVK